MRSQRGNTRIFLILIICTFLQMPALRVLPADTNSGQIETSARRFIEFLSTVNYDSAYQGFDSNVKEQISVNTLKEIWESILLSAGNFEKIKELKRSESGGYQIIFVSCQFTNAPVDFKLVFNSQDEIAGFFIIPAQSNQDFQTAEYVDQKKFISEEVTIGKAPWKLPGTLTIPNQVRPAPALVLVHGSGPQDRDETVGPNKPFLDLAGGLSSRGIAVLRYEKRTKAHAPAMSELKDRLTVNEETVEDVHLALEFLQHRSDVDQDHIFVLGHSLGAMMVPRIALRDTISAGFIIMAGATRPLEDLILEQVMYIADLDCVITETEISKIEKLKEEIARVKDPALDKSVSPERLPLGIPAAYWLDLRGYQPAVEAAKITRPILILQGERDYQVTMRDLEGWRQTLAYANDVEIIVLPSLNHLFITGEGKSSPAEYSRPGHVAVNVVETIVNWIGSY